MRDTELLRELIAERAIGRIVLRYAHGIDRLDFDVVRDCFHSDANLVYGGPGDGKRDQALDWLESALPALAGSSHFFGAPRIELDLARGMARVETYSLNTTRQPEDEQGRVFATYTGARYLDRFECRATDRPDTNRPATNRPDGEWRIAHRELMRDRTQRVLEVPDASLPATEA